MTPALWRAIKRAFGLTRRCPDTGRVSLPDPVPTRVTMRPAKTFDDLDPFEPEAEVIDLDSMKRKTASR